MPQKVHNFLNPLLPKHRYIWLELFVGPFFLDGNVKKSNIPFLIQQPQERKISASNLPPKTPIFNAAKRSFHLTPLISLKPMSKTKWDLCLLQSCIHMFIFGICMFYQIFSCDSSSRSPPVRASVGGTVRNLV